MSATTYPVRLDGRPDEQLSQWLWLVKWFLVIPHLVVLAFLWITLWVLTVFAFFAILITGRYPRSVFDFNVGVLRWTWRVGFYAYAALGTDRYPPFTLAERPDYPATLEIDYPQRLSRGLVLVKWWLLAIPHYLVIGFFLGGAGFVGWRWGDTTFLGGSGLIAVLVLIGAVILLFTGRFPRGISGFVLGMNRWVARVGGYALLMTDQYPPFRLDNGPEPDGPAEQSAPDTQPGAQRSTAGRVAAVVAGALLMLIGLGAAGTGGVGLWAYQNRQDANGYINTDTQHYSTSAQALRFDDVDIRWAPTWLLGDIRVHATSSKPVFLGIGNSADVDRYLGYDGYGRMYGMMNGFRPSVWRGDPLGSQPVWVASGSGELTWPVQRGQWTLVVMNADRGAGLDVELSAGATVPGLLPISIGLLAFGALAIAGGAGLQFAGLRRRVARS